MDSRMSLFCTKQTKWDPKENWEFKTNITFINKNLNQRKNKPMSIYNEKI